MNRRSVVSVILACAVWMTACGSKSNPVAPTPPPVPACQTNNTALVSFGNRSRATTHTVLWDGLTIATLAPGEDSARITTAAGVAHRLETRIANTTLLACNPSTPILTQCADTLYTCAFP
jgi:hypothetical protein